MIPTNLQPLPKEIQISPVEDPKKGNFLKLFSMRI